MGGKTSKTLFHYSFASLNFIPLLPVVTTLLRGENDSKQSDEIKATVLQHCCNTSCACFVARFTELKGNHDHQSSCFDTFTSLLQFLNLRYIPLHCFFFSCFFPCIYSSLLYLPVGAHVIVMLGRQVDVILKSRNNHNLIVIKNVEKSFDTCFFFFLLCFSWPKSTAPGSLK